MNEKINFLKPDGMEFQNSKPLAQAYESFAMFPSNNLGVSIDNPSLS